MNVDAVARTEHLIACPSCNAVICYRCGIYEEKLNQYADGAGDAAWRRSVQRAFDRHLERDHLRREWPVTNAITSVLAQEQRAEAAEQERDEAVARAEMVEAEHATLMSMTEKAASVLREFADFDPDERLAHPVAVVQAKANRALRALREIAGLEAAFADPAPIAPPVHSADTEVR